MTTSAETVCCSCTKEEESVRRDCAKRGNSALRELRELLEIHADDMDDDDDDNTIPWLYGSQFNSGTLMTLAIVALMISRKYNAAKQSSEFMTAAFCLMSAWGGGDQVRVILDHGNLKNILRLVLDRVRELHEGDDEDSTRLYMRALRRLPFAAPHLVPPTQHSSPSSLITDALYNCWWLPKLNTPCNDECTRRDSDECAGEDYGVTYSVSDAAESCALRELIGAAETYCDQVGARIRELQAAVAAAGEDANTSIEAYYLTECTPAILVRELGSQYADLVTPYQPTTCVTRFIEVRRGNGRCTCRKCTARVQ